MLMAFGNEFGSAKIMHIHMHMYLIINSTNVWWCNDANNVIMAAIRAQFEYYAGISSLKIKTVLNWDGS